MAASTVKLNAFGLSNLDRKCIKVALEVLEKKRDSIYAELVRREGSDMAAWHGVRLLRALMEEPKVETGAQS